MKSIVKISKTVEEAIDEAVKELGVDRKEVRFEVIEEPSKGLFGFIGSKDAKVKVTVVNDPVEIAETFTAMLLNGMHISGNAKESRKNTMLFVLLILEY